MLYLPIKRHFPKIAKIIAKIVPAKLENRPFAKKVSRRDLVPCNTVGGLLPQFRPCDTFENSQLLFKFPNRDVYMNEYFLQRSF